MQNQRFTDEFRAEAVATLKSAGYPDQKGALTRVAKQLGISYQVLSGWATGKYNPPPQNVLCEKKNDLRSMFDAELRAVLGLMPEKRDYADYRELVTASGVFFDKLRLMDNLPTEIIEVMPSLTKVMDAAKARGIPASTVFEKMFEVIVASDVGVAR